MRNRHPHALPLIALFASTLVATSPSASQRAPLADLDVYVTQAMKAWRPPGLAFAVVKNGEVVARQGYGVRELGRPIASTRIRSLRSDRQPRR